MKAEILVLITFGFIFLSSGNKENAFYVSPEGSDTYPGTIEKTFKTIQAARNAVRELKDAKRYRY